MRAYTNTDELAGQMQTALDALHASINDTPEADEAYTTLENFVAVALRVISKTNPSKVRDCARTEWIKGLMDGKPQK